jgi:hypothetical protein
MSLYYIYKDAKGEFRWRFMAANYKILADSAEGHCSKAGCEHAIDVIKRDSPSASVVDITDK